MRFGKPVAMLAVGLAAMIVLLAPVPAFAQGCALCYTQAAQSGSRMIQALRSGILILIAPPTFGSVGLIFVCYKKRNQTRETDDSDLDGEWNDENSPRDSFRKGNDNGW